MFVQVFAVIQMLADSLEVLWGVSGVQLILVFPSTSCSVSFKNICANFLGAQN